MRSTAVCSMCMFLWLIAPSDRWPGSLRAEAHGGESAGAASAQIDPLDRQLLEDLEGRPGVEQSGRMPSTETPPARLPPPAEEQPVEPAQGPAETTTPEGSRTPPEDLEAQLRQELGEAAVSEEEQPLLEIARQMRMVQRRIGQYDSGSVTQGIQHQILADLDRLIQQARRACRPGTPSSAKPQQVASRTPVRQPGSQPSAARQPSRQPGSTSTPREGQTEASTAGPQMEQLRELVKNLWGELPARARQQMLESFDEAFVPKYRLLIEQYFRRLAEAGSRGQ